MQNLATGRKSAPRRAVRRGLCAGVAAVFLVVSACATPDGNTYTSSDVGQIIETSQGRVLSSRQVAIKSDENSGVGAVGGAAAGGATGYQIGSGNGQVLATVLGALIGAGAGYLAENEIRNREGIEYIVELEDGRVVTLVQNSTEDDEAIANGDPVLVQFGSRYTRINRLEVDRSGHTKGGGEWVNPDAGPAASGTGDAPTGLGDPVLLNSGQGQED